MATNYDPLDVQGGLRGGSRPLTVPPSAPRGYTHYFTNSRGDTGRGFMPSSSRDLVPVEKPVQVSAQGASTPSAPGLGQKLMGSPDEWRAFGNKVRDFGSKLAAEDSFQLRQTPAWLRGRFLRGAMGAGNLAMGVSGLADVASGVANGDMGQTALGAADTTASVLSKTPAAPLAGLYVAGRVGTGIGSAINDHYIEPDRDLSDAIGGTINAGLRRIGLGVDDSAYLQQRAEERRGQARGAAPPAARRPTLRGGGNDAVDALMPPDIGAGTGTGGAAPGGAAAGPSPTLRGGGITRIGNTFTDNPGAYGPAGSALRSGTAPSQRALAAADALAQRQGGTMNTAYGGAAADLPTGGNYATATGGEALRGALDRESQELQRMVAAQRRIDGEGGVYITPDRNAERNARFDQDQLLREALRSGGRLGSALMQSYNRIQDTLDQPAKDEASLSEASLRERSATERAAMADMTTRRGQDLSDATTRRGQDVSLRGQDMEAATATQRNRIAAESARQEQANKDRQFDLEKLRYGAERADAMFRQRESADKDLTAQLEAMFTTRDRDGKVGPDVAKVGRHKEAINSYIAGQLEKLEQVPQNDQRYERAQQLAQNLRSRGASALGSDRLQRLMAQLEARERASGRGNYVDSANPEDFDIVGRNEGVFSDDYVLRSGQTVPTRLLDYQDGGSAWLPNRWVDNPTRRFDTLRGGR